MKRLLVAFDVDDTLIVPPAPVSQFDIDTPNYEVIALFRWFQAQGHEMVVWSGGGADYAARWAAKLGLVADHYLDKHTATSVDGVPLLQRPDLAFDDSDLTLATVNVKVKRINNKVVRYPERVAKAV